MHPISSSRNNHYWLRRERLVLLRLWNPWFHARIPWTHKSILGGWLRCLLHVSPILKNPPLAQKRVLRVVYTMPNCNYICNVPSCNHRVLSSSIRYHRDFSQLGRWCRIFWVIWAINHQSIPSRPFVGFRNGNI